jgi:hypothetical protein
MARLPQGRELVSQQQCVRLLLVQWYGADRVCSGWWLYASVRPVLVKTREVEMML